jgi:hypothetical protein
MSIVAGDNRASVGATFGSQPAFRQRHDRVWKVWTPSFPLHRTKPFSV